MLTPEQRREIQKRFKIPVDSSHPGTCWIVSIDCESLMPIDEELAQIKSYIEFAVRKIYLEGYAERIIIKPLPVESGHNTMILRKGSPLHPEVAGWFYRKSTWHDGPTYYPHSTTEAGYQDHGLVLIFDLYESIFPERWASWKTGHPDIFPVFR